VTRGGNHLGIHGGDLDKAAVLEKRKYRDRKKERQRRALEKERSESSSPPPPPPPIQGPSLCDQHQRAGPAVLDSIVVASPSPIFCEGDQQQASLADLYPQFREVFLPASEEPHEPRLEAERAPPLESRPEARKRSREAVDTEDSALDARLARLEARYQKIKTDEKAKKKEKADVKKARHGSW
jgi:hypothetical protein